MKDGSGSAEVDKIVKIDMATWEVVAVSETFPLDHANDMTYDPATNQLIVVNMLANTISMIDAETLAYVGNKALAYGTWGAGYVDGASQYAFLAYGTPSGLVITDTDFNPIRSSPLASAPDYTGQGMDADSKYAYVPLSPSSGKNENIIQIYDIATGEYLGIVSVATKMESESMFHANGKQYMHFNSQGSQIAELEYYVRFE
jgi:DNA-binding beta-propeller fold protein YncE